MNTETPVAIVYVFVSSTYLDLQPERKAVEAALQRLRETKFVGMEYFGSRDEDTRRASLDEVDRSQVYVGIFGGRYGSGITEAEYRRARERGLTCRIYFKDEAAITSEGREMDSEKAAKLATLKEELRRSHTTPIFTTPDDLAAKVTADLHCWLFNEYLAPRLERAMRGEVPPAEAQALLAAIRDLSALSEDLLACLQEAGYVSPQSLFGKILRDADLLARGHLDKFVGRVFLDAALDTFLNTHDRGYFLLIGEPGIGKTAWVAHLVHTRGYLYHFISAPKGRTDARTALENLCAQLITRFGLDHQWLPPNAGDNGDFLAQLLQEATERQGSDQKLILVIDALDEADRPAHPAANLLYLPDNLPTGVYFILTSRPVSLGDILLQVERGVAKKELPLDSASTDNQADIRHYLQVAVQRPNIASRLAEQGITESDFVAALAERSAGNFMYLVCALDDIAEGEMDPLVLDQLPHGLAEYYAWFWRRLQAATDEDIWLDWHELLLGLLAAAQEPVTVEQLAAWLGRDDAKSLRRVERLLTRDWRRFLTPTKHDDHTLWRPYHQSFQDFLAGVELTLDASQSLRDLLAERRKRTSEAHATIADYYVADRSKWEQEGGYAFRHLSKHLIASGHTQELYQLVESQEWYESQRSYEPSRWTYSQDVRIALDKLGTEGMQGWPRLVAYSLLQGTLQNLSFELTVADVREMIDAGDYKAIRRWANMVPSGAWFKVELIQLAGEVAALADQQDRAIAEFYLALDELRSVPTFGMPHKLLMSIAVDLAELGDARGIDLALVAADELPDDLFYRFLMPSTQIKATLQDLRNHLSEERLAEWKKRQEASYQKAMDKLTDPKYMRASVNLLSAPEGTATAYAVWSRVLAECDESTLAQQAFSLGKSISRAIETRGKVDKVYVLVELIRSAVALSQSSRDEIQQMIGEAIDLTETANYPPIGALVALTNLLVEIEEPNEEKLIQYTIRQIANWQPTIFERALWLTDLAPGVHLLEQPKEILAELLGNEPVRSIVQIVWEAMNGGAEQFIVALQGIETNRERLSDADVALFARAFNALVPALALPEHDELMEQAIVLSETFLPDIERAEFLAKLVLAISPRVDRERILGKVQELLTSSSTEMKDRLLLRVAPVLAPLARPSDQCLVSLVQQSFNANRSSGRAFVLYQIERLSPLIKALGGCDLAVETWKRIQTVEGLFQFHSGYPLPDQAAM